MIPNSDNTYNIERAILSSFIFEATTFENTKMKKENFTLPFHQDVFNAIEELHKEKKPIDDEFIKIKLKKLNKFNELAMLDLIASNPISNVMAYEKQLLENYLKRKHIQGLQKVITDIKEGVTSFDESIQKVKTLEQNIVENNNISDFAPIQKIENIKAKTPKFFLKNLLPIQEKEITMLTSKGGGGKSFVAIWIASMLSSIEGKKVFAYLSEDSVQNTKNRFEILKKVNQNMGYFDIWGKESRPKNFIKRTKEGMEATTYFFKFTNHFKDYDIIILDPLIAFIYEDENSNTEARFLFSLLNEWCERENKTLVLIHHHNKNDETRGASAFVDAVRLHYVVEKKKNNDTSRFLKLEKTNHYAGKSEFEIKLFEDEFKNNSVKEQ